MKKLLLVAITLTGLVAGRVEAQSTCFLPSACGTTTFTGGTLTGPLLLPDGSASAPSLAFSGLPGMGIYRSGTTFLMVRPNNDIMFQFWGSSRLDLLSDAAQLSLGEAVDLILARDAANTLAMRNSTAAQTFNIYNTYTDASNYERGAIFWTANQFKIDTQAAGTGTTTRSLVLSSGNDVSFTPTSGNTYFYSNAVLTPTDSRDIGNASILAKSLYLTRSIQGSKSKALTESSATSFTQVAVPQTAGANYAAGEVIYTVYATDGTDSQTLQGRVAFSAVNKAGTETCSIGVAYTEVLAVSTASTLTCTHTCVTGLTDAVQIASNCVSSLTQTTFTIESRLDMPRPNTVTPQ